jgi:DNA-binding beta-propeller fold protein YncE
MTPQFKIILCIVFLYNIGVNYINSQCYNQNSAFKAGEKLYYNVYYNLGFMRVKLADVKLWVEESVHNNKTILIIQNTTKTVSEFERIIKVKDYYASYIDASNMKVLKHIQKTLVDKFYTDYEFNFDHNKQKLYVSIENSKTKRYFDTLDMNTCLHDLLSAAYYPRNIDYSNMPVGQKTTIPIILETKTNIIYFKYMGIENKNIKGKKKVSCIKVVPLLVATSIFKAGEKMTFWLSNDKNKLPVLMESDLKIGKVSVQLFKYEGLRYSVEY